MRYEVVTNLSPREALQQAVAFFGTGGEGLQLTTKRPGHLVFQGGGGHVSIVAKARDTETILDLETREWDAAVQKFMSRVSRRRHWWRRWWQRKGQRATIRSASALPFLNQVPKEVNKQTPQHVNGSTEPKGEQHG